MEPGEEPEVQQPRWEQEGGRCDRRAVDGLPVEAARVGGEGRGGVWEGGRPSLRQGDTAGKAELGLPLGDCGRLLLGDAVYSAEPVDELPAVDRDDLSSAEEF